jgi:hypothetical protein
VGLRPKVPENGSESRRVGTTAREAIMEALRHGVIVWGGYVAEVSDEGADLLELDPERAFARAHVASAHPLRARRFTAVNANNFDRPDRVHPQRARVVMSGRSSV